MIIVFDMGATHTRVAASTDGIALSDPIIFDTEQNFETGIAKLITYIKKLSTGEAISCISGGTTGALDPDRNIVRQSLNLPGWANKPLKQRLSDHFNTSTYLANDMEMIGLGEATKGAGKDKTIVAYITISTGVGGIRIVNGKPDKSTWSFEIGGHVISRDDNNQLLTFEDLVGGRALQERYGKTPKEIALDKNLWPKVIDALAIGIHNAILFWSPEVIVFGGAMMKDIPLNQVRDKVSDIMVLFPSIPEFRPSELGDRGGLLGALALAQLKS